ncbi:hypothetical protein CAPTEDRAFT_206592 [Capitella teleta]|uniref:RING-type domain-containing protein n=1 Tax=Capitella teleta TaxID=283909 RepID=R7U2Q1_CAPTE|nr:hypothetical protein CAPTEDRAFT_206592 [Capitella teleta]|eukprot:ELU00625.1 hypothetical protein CAPTEDRAFT_206592 [Capitella teleta]
MSNSESAGVMSVLHCHLWDITCHRIPDKCDVINSCAFCVINICVVKDRLLSRIEEGEGEVTLTQDEECVVCLASKATMQTFPCGHKVVCRKCFIKTIQVAVTTRSLPLTCVVCRTKILKLKQTGEESSSSSSTSSKKHSGQGSTARKLAGPAQLARQLLSGGSGAASARQQSSSSQASSKHHHDGHPATKIMKPLLICPSQSSSPRHQQSIGASEPTPLAKNTAIRPSHKIYSPKRAVPRRPQVASTDSPLMSGKAWGDRPCQHIHKLDTKYTHLLSPRVTSRCSHCSPVDNASMQIVQQGV